MEIQILVFRQSLILQMIVFIYSIRRFKFAIAEALQRMVLCITRPAWDQVVLQNSVTFPNSLDFVDRNKVLTSLLRERARIKALLQNVVEPVEQISCSALKHQISSV